MAGSGWGNPVVGGTTLRIPAIQSPNFSMSAMTGWAIFANGNAYFFNITAAGTITATQFNGNDFIIDSAGEFFYSGTPAAGNLVLSASQNSGTDGEGNPFYQGFTAYGTSTAASLWNNGTYAGLVMHLPLSATLTTAAQLFTVPLNSGLASETTETTLTSGKESGNDDAAIQLFSEAADASAAALCLIEFGGQVEVAVARGFGIRAIQPGTTTTIESWHALAPASGWANVAGNVPLKYKLMPDRRVWVLGTLSAAAATATTIGTLPAGYRPATQQAFPVATNSGGAATSDRYLQVTTAGVMTVNDYTALPIAGNAYINGFISLDA
jgi:hypothetical protein